MAHAVRINSNTNNNFFMGSLWLRQKDRHHRKGWCRSERSDESGSVFRNYSIFVFVILSNQPVLWQFDSDYCGNTDIETTPRRSCHNPRPITVLPNPQRRNRIKYFPINICLISFQIISSKYHVFRTHFFTLALSKLHQAA